MTAQTPDKFLNKHHRIETKWLRLYFVSAELPAKPRPPEDFRLSTDLWRGYIATWLLNVDGTLELVQFEFPYFDGDPFVQPVQNGLVSGDFTLTFRPFFGGPNTEIPFVNGRVVEDRARWQIDDQTFEVLVVRRLSQSGLVVENGGAY